MENEQLPVWEDPAYYASIRGAESGGDDAAKNPLSSATGRYQFTGGTWKATMRAHPELGLTPDGRLDGEQQERAIRALTKDNAQALQAGGVEVTKGTAYAAHFLGSSGAVTALKAEDGVPMAGVVSPAVMAANPFLGRMNVGQFKTWAAKKAGGSASDAPAVTFDEIGAPKPFTRDELQAANAEREAPSLFETTKDAIRSEWSLLWALDGRTGLAPDPDYRVDAEALKAKATQYGVPASKFSYLAQAHSAEHLDYLGAQYQEDAEREQRLANAGGTGVALRIAAGLLDPAAWAAGAGIAATTGGLGLPAFVAAKAGRAGLMGLTGAEAALANVSTDAIIAAQKPITDDNMLLYSAGTGFILGGALGAMRKNPLTATEAARLEAVGRNMHREVEGLPQRAYGPDQEAYELPGSGGAAAASPRDHLRMDASEMDSIAKAVDTGGVFTPEVRFDLAASLKKSLNSLTRVLGDNLVADGVGSKDRSRASTFSAEEVQKQLHVQAEVRWSRDYGSAYKDFGERNGFNWLDWDRKREDFGAQVTDYVRNKDPMIEFDPAVAKAGEAQRKLLASWAAHLNNPGLLDGGNYRAVKGAEELGEDRNYAPRITDVRAVDEHLNAYGNKQLEALVAHAIRSGRDDIDDALTAKVSKAYVKRLQSVSYGEELTKGRVVGGDDLESFREMLTAETDLSPDEIARFTTFLEKPAQDGAKPRLKTRLQLDESASLVLTNQMNGERSVVRFADLFVKDANELVRHYNRWASGMVAMARVKVKNPNYRGDEADGPEFLIDGVTSQSEFVKLKDQVRAIGEMNGIGRLDTDKDLRRLQFAYDAITGVPHPDEATPFGTALRMIRDYNFIRVMNQVGFAQIPELVNIGGHLGMKAMWHGTPPLRSLIRNARTGAIDEELADELELITGSGTDWLRGADNSRWDDFGNPMTITGQSPVLNGVDNVLRKGKRVTSAISGMAPINTLLQRWVSRAMAAKFADIARNPTAANMNRMRSLGLSDEMLERVRGQLKEHGDFMKGEVSGKNLRRLNVEKWDDLEAGSAFRQAMFRGARRIIQENDVGNMAQWMSHPLARSLLQFRTFVLGSWTKNLLHNIRMNDFATYATFMGSMFAGALTYIGQTHLNSLGREDKEDFLEKRLSFAAITKASLQRSSWFSLFGPGVDTIGTLTVGGPVFDARTTGLPSNVLWGNPTFDLGDGLAKAGSALIGGVRDGEATKNGVRNVTRTLPFSNFAPFVGLTNTLIDGLPDYDDRPGR